MALMVIVVNTKGSQLAWLGVLILLAVIFTPVSGVLGQTSAVGPRLMPGGSAEELASSPVIRDALNRPCLDIEAATRAHIVNRESYDHIVSIKNNCSRIIKVKVCYFKSESCSEATLRGYNRSDIILGTMIGVRTFRYTVSQK